MGVKGNPSVAELMCYFCNLSLDLRTWAPEPRNHQKEKTGAPLLCCQRKEGRPTFVDTVNSPEEILQGCKHTFCLKKRRGGGIIKESSFEWEEFKTFRGFIKSICDSSALMDEAQIFLFSKEKNADSALQNRSFFHRSNNRKLKKTSEFLGHTDVCPFEGYRWAVTQLILSVSYVKKCHPL